jgi:hypothetical protein
VWREENVAQERNDTHDMISWEKVINDRGDIFGSNESPCICVMNILVILFKFKRGLLEAG